MERRFQRVLEKQKMKFMLRTKVANVDTSGDIVKLTLEPAASGEQNTLKADFVPVPAGATTVHGSDQVTVPVASSESYCTSKSCSSERWRWSNNHKQSTSAFERAQNPVMEGVLADIESMLVQGRMELPLSLCFAVLRGDDLLLYQLLKRGLDLNELDSNG
ncbi:hypothetical protein AAG906_006787 [Vitis piasezkii]